ncbi:MAG: hypothetical protein ACTJG2_04140 [Candidatus Saccharimonadales bacterium]
MIKKLMNSGGLLLLFFITFASIGALYSQPVAADDDRVVRDERAYWNRGDILVQAFVDSSSEVTCDDFRTSNPAASMKDCLADTAPEPVKSTLDKLKDSDVSTDRETATPSNGGAKTTFTADLGTENEVKIECIAQSGSLKCTLEYATIHSSLYTSRGFDNGETVFLSDDRDEKLFVNRTIQRTDNGYDDLDKDIVGEVYLTWQENAFYYETDKQYEKLRDDYVEKCQKDRGGGDCATTLERAHGAFTQIWRTCVVASGVLGTDTQNAANCLLANAGVKLNTSAVLEDLPDDPSRYTDTASCGISTMGYVLCPIMRFLGNAADTMFGLVKNLLTVAPLDPNGEGGQNAQRAWRVFVNIANVVFIILFMLIVFAQLTNFGISNYGIKRLLPRIIIGAILVNASFYICILAIDISNVLGDSIQKVMVIINDEVFSSVNEKVLLTADMETSGGNESGWEFITDKILMAGVIAGGVVATAAMVFMFIPIMTAVVLAGITVVMTLIVRYGLILLLTIIAPIAFALYLLPNTQKWFTKWRTMFISLLMLFPIVSAVFGLSTLAANIVMQVASAQDAQMLAIFALAIQAIPLAVTPIILKSGGQLLGSIGGSIKNNNLFGKARGFSKDSQTNLNKRMQRRALEGKAVPFGRTMRFAQRNKSKATQRKATLRRMEAEHFSNYLNGAEGSGGERTSAYERFKGRVSEDYTPKTKGEILQDQMAAVGDAGAKDRAAAYALSSQHSILTDEIKANKLTMSGEDPEESARKVEQAVQQRTGSQDHGGADANMLANISHIGDTGDGLAMRSVVENSGSMTETERNYTAQTASKTSVFMQDPDAQHAIAAGRVSSREDFNRQIVEPMVTRGNFSAATVKRMDTEDKQMLHEAYTSGHLSPEAMESIRDVAGQSLDNSKVSKTLTPGKETENFKAMAGRNPGQ